MTVFFLIGMLWALLQLAARLGLNPRKRGKGNVRMATGIAFMITGALHFLIPDRFLIMMPPFLPQPLLIIYVSGFFEILGGIGLFIPQVRRAAAWGLVALLICVFPANIYTALYNVQLGGYMSSSLYQWLRLPMQAVLIWWVVWCAEAVKRPTIYEGPYRNEQVTA